MRIITQDGHRSFNFDNLDIVCEEEIIYTSVNDKRLVLGKYESQERAFEVFSGLHLCYEQGDKLFKMPQQ